MDKHLKIELASNFKRAESLWIVYISFLLVWLYEQVLVAFIQLCHGCYGFITGY